MSIIGIDNDDIIVYHLTTIKQTREGNQMEIIDMTKEELRAKGLCEYCWVEKSEGYVKAYDAHVCEDCYEDHHGLAV